MAKNNFRFFMKRLFHKGKQPQIEVENFPTFTLSENALLFITKYAIPYLSLNEPITQDTADKIFDFAMDCELNMIDPLSKDGCDKAYDYPEKERDNLGCQYIGEVSGYASKNRVIDLDDLNKRLGLI